MAGAKKTIDLAKTEAVKSEFMLPLVLTKVVVAQVRAGDSAAAAASAESISDPENKAMIYEAIAQAQIDAGDLSAAKSNAAKLKGTRYEMDLNLGFAEAQAKAHDSAGATKNLDDAKATAAKIDVPLLQSFATARIAASQTRCGDIPGAIQYAHSLKNPEPRASALCAIVQTLSRESAKHP